MQFESCFKEILPLYNSEKVNFNIYRGEQNSLEVKKEFVPLLFHRPSLSNFHFARIHQLNMHEIYSPTTGCIYIAKTKEGRK